MLLLAYACSPYRGSEPGAGWHRVLEISKYCDAWVICKEKRYQSDIVRYVAENGPLNGLTFHFVKNTKFEKILKGLPGFWYVAYRLWHRRAFRLARELSRDHHFDLCHQVNMCGFREPGYLWKLDVPFVWGPIGGTQNYPFRFLAASGLGGAVKEALRSIINLGQLRYSPRVRHAVRKASAIVVANSQAERDFVRFYGVRPRRILDVGIDSHVDAIKPKKLRGDTLNILWSGALNHHKALHLLFESLKSLPPQVKYEVRILGRGPLAGRWRRLARKYHLDDRCKWTGWLPHEEALDQYRWADIFVFTSLRDTCGTVVLEALSAGVPVVCLDHQGAGDVVTPDCGVKIPVLTPEDTIRRLSSTIEMLATKSQVLEALSQGAKSRAEDFLWTRNGELMQKVYETVLAGNTGNSPLLRLAEGESAGDAGTR